MSTADDLLAACVATPDDDEPRLVWADAVGGERGELVVIQCRLAREELPPAEAGALLRRADELLAAHGKAWSGFSDTPAVKRCLYRRGFVEAVQANVVEMPWTQIFEHAPLLNTLEVKGVTQVIDHRAVQRLGPDPIAFLSELFQQPAFERLRGIGIDGVALYEAIGDDEWDNDYTPRIDELLEMIAKTGSLGGMRALAIHDRFTQRGMHELIGSNVLPSIERLVLDGGHCSRDQARELLANAPNLRALDIGTTIPLFDIADVIPATLVELRAPGVQQMDIRSLFSMPAAATLERLFVHSHLSPYLDQFGVFQRLRSLDVSYTAVTGPNQGDSRREAAGKFARASLPALRELRVFADLTAVEVNLIAGSYGAQLACLDIRGQNHLASPALHDRVAGYVRMGPSTPSSSFLHVGTNTREPWLGYGTVVVHR
jgi:uncharacterized protein (TIGR02996 family)